MISTQKEAQKAHNAEKALQDAQLAAQREEAQRARKAVEAEAQRACEAAEAEAQKARELILAELKEALELAYQEKALLEAELEAKKEAAAHEHELKMASLGRHPPPDRASAFDPARNIRLVPPSKKRRLINILLILRKLLIV